MITCQYFFNIFFYFFLYCSFFIFCNLIIPPNKSFVNSFFKKIKKVLGTNGCSLYTCFTCQKTVKQTIVLKTSRDLRPRDVRKSGVGEGRVGKVSALQKDFSISLSHPRKPFIFKGFPLILPFRKALEIV